MHLSCVDAQHVLENWKNDYNNQRPHASLHDLPPAQFRTRELNTEIVSERSKQRALTIALRAAAVDERYDEEVGCPIHAMPSDGAGGTLRSSTGLPCGVCR